MEEYQTVS